MQIKEKICMKCKSLFFKKKKKKKKKKKMSSSDISTQHSVHQST